ncbi:MAG: hypothetical protein MJB57_15605 [Gemmatimonadetes bacterium]|nr:hypothetical protein [Gemmatimonadota bacterium]
MKNLFREIHRRSLWQVLGVYVAGGWVVLQIVDTLAGALNLPEWADSLALFMLIVGLPIVMATAIIQGGGAPAAAATPEAVGDSTDAGDRDAGEGPTTRDSGGGYTSARAATSGAAGFFTWRNVIGGGVVALAVWGLIAIGWVLTSGAGLSPAEASASPSRAILPQGEARRKSVAVLPFENQITDAAYAYFADGVHESVLTQLGRIGDLRVLSRDAMMRYRDYRETGRTLREISDELGAGAVLQGTVRRAADAIRVTVELVDPLTDESLWRQQIEGGASEIFEIETRVAIAVAGELEAALSPGEAEALTRPQTESLDALDFYLRGRQTASRRRGEDNEEAIRLFRLAIEADSGFALAWTGLAGGYLSRTSLYGYPPAWVDSADVAGRRALALDSMLAEGHLSLAWTAFTRGRYEETKAIATRVLDLNPNLVSAATLYGYAHIFTGDWAGALRGAKAAYRLDPTNPSVRDALIIGYQDLREFDIAERWLDEALERDPRSPQVRRIQQTHAIQRGEPEEAYRVFRRWMEESGEDDAYVLTVAVNAAHYAREYDDVIELSDRLLAIARGGTRGASYQDVRVARAFAIGQRGELDTEALELLASAEQEYSMPLDRGVDGWLFPLYLAEINMARRAYEEGLDWLAQAVDAGFAGWHLLAQDPLFDAVRETPRYRELQATMQGRLEAHREAIEREEIEAGER